MSASLRSRIHYEDSTVNALNARIQMDRTYKKEESARLGARLVFLADMLGLAVPSLPFLAAHAYLGAAQPVDS